MNIYYLDEPLSRSELVTAKAFIAKELAAHDLKAIQQIKLPLIHPQADDNGSYDQQLEQHVDDICQQLSHTELMKDIGRHVLWVMPQDITLGVRFQLSIEKLTSQMPFVIQRWYFDTKMQQARRGDCRILNHSWRTL